MYINFSKLPEEAFTQVPIPRTFWDKLFLRKQKFYEAFDEEKIPNTMKVCNTCKQNNFEVWQSKCPKCWGEMKEIAFIGLWD